MAWISSIQMGEKKFVQNTIKIGQERGKKQHLWSIYLLFKLFICISFSNDDNSGDQCLYINRMLLLLFNEDDDNHYDYQKHFFFVSKGNMNVNILITNVWSNDNIFVPNEWIIHTHTK